MPRPLKHNKLTPPNPPMNLLRILHRSNLIMPSNHGMIRLLRWRIRRRFIKPRHTIAKRRIVRLIPKADTRTLKLLLRLVFRRIQRRNGIQCRAKVLIVSHTTRPQTNKRIFIALYVWRRGYSGSYTYGPSEAVGPCVAEDEGGYMRRVGEDVAEGDEAAVGSAYEDNLLFPGPLSMWHIRTAGGRCLRGKTRLTVSRLRRRPSAHR